ncbi:MAG: hypothetical protein GWN99_12260 [Gemmatimonadetes bacterium]|uniref:Zinc-finger domain-containing protein n=1 Tax=Candidatus Kutchimonas denitrificans TaxID=3056748 RepID=A0AAE4Z897_9BACT|nr:hypothetical protein [Gemmatimonadota bacterium]NIR75503.1 hypothetical protein [Candidatus Kutchimonas denitrificans]NIS01817.1 hypothetical protein [Gemmatimonadota bacterium]NIT67598.1 hypothetical protein [Gemmatimonadota bacterium]NIU53472.1 hypothetical protein [Gemmatimonadota bacterium]
MDCEEFLQDYSDYFDWRLEEHSLCEYRLHLSNCPSCHEYDRVMRSGLHLIKNLEAPHSHPDITSRVQEKIAALNRRLGQRTGELGRALAVAGLTAVAVLLITSLPVFQPSGGTVELPPVVVDRRLQAVPSVFGPAPRFRSSSSVMRMPAMPEPVFLVTPQDRASLFGTPLVDVTAEREPASPVTQ